MTNFTIQDLQGVSRALPGFAAILMAPGYLLAFAVDLFGFRRQSLLERLAWSIALSFVFAPIATQLAGRVIDVGGVASLFLMCGIILLILLCLQHKTHHMGWTRYSVLLAVFLLFGTIVVIGEMIDIQSGHGLNLSVTVADQAFRVQFVNAIAHTGIPPRNPLYHPGVAEPLRYYYFWYALCAVCMKLAHVTARQALMASSVWAGVGLVALIALFARHFLQVRDNLQRFILVTSLLLAVTGLDLLPVLFNLSYSHIFAGDLEWWSIDQIASWLDTILWVPNHTAALISCLTAFLLLWRTRESTSHVQDPAAILLAGVAAASAFGLSVYVSAGFGLLMAGWLVLVLYCERDVPLLRRVALVAVVSGILIVPYLRDLLAASSGTQDRAAAAPTHLLAFSVRKMIDANLIIELPVFGSIHRAHPVLIDQGMRLLLLLPGYALELGASGLVLVVLLGHRRELDKPQRTALTLVLGGLLLVSFVRSSVIGNNDFGYRAALVPCFFLLLLTARFLTSKPEKGRPLLASLVLSLFLLIGVAGTAFQALLLRTFVALHVAAAKAPPFLGLPNALYNARSAFDMAATTIPATAIVQANPINPGHYDSIANMLFAQRAMATDAEVDCGAVFGGNPSNCSQVQNAAREIFAEPVLPVSEIVERCRRLGIDFLAVSSFDPAWQQKGGWVWTLPLAGASAPDQVAPDTGFRVVKCVIAPGSTP